MAIRVGVMQPYIFPYIGYFQLINAVDHFVFYDDVNFIKQGWINRNRLLINGKEQMFTLPLQKASSFTLIKDTEIHPVIFQKWQKKFMKGVEQNYKKAPYFKETYFLLEQIFNTETDKISILAQKSIVLISSYLKINTNFKLSSIDFPETKGLDKADRLVEICQNLKSQHYINPSGGKELYDKSYFKENGIRLNFISSHTIQYRQFNDEFISWLSIIDVLMFNSIENISIFLNNYNLE